MQILDTGWRIRGFVKRFWGFYSLTFNLAQRLAAPGGLREFRDADGGIRDGDERIPTFHKRATRAT